MPSKRFLIVWTILWVLLAAFMAFGVSAEVQEIGPFKTYHVLTLTQTCSNCTFVNITRVTYPNSTQSFINLPMSQPVSGNFNLTTSAFTQDNGDYIVTTCGNPDGIYTCADYIFTVNPLGKVLTEPQARMYGLILIIAGIFFILCIALGIYLPSTNKKDEMTGYVIAIDNLKYLKMFFLCISYLSFLLIIYFSYIISYAYLDLDFLGGIFHFVFSAMAWLIVPFFILGLYILIMNKIKDSKLAYELSRGFNVK